MYVAMLCNLLLYRNRCRYAVMPCTCTCVYICTCMSVCCIHFHFATNEPGIYVLWIFFEFEYSKPFSVSQKQTAKETQKNFFIFRVLPHLSVCEFQYTEFDGGTLIDFSITCKWCVCVRVCEWGKNFATCLNSRSSSRSSDNNQQANEKASEAQAKFLQITSEICVETIWMGSKKNA